jgi:hypothetical protein
MADALGFPLSGPRRRHEGTAISAIRRWHRRDRADADLICRAAVWLRANPDQARHVGLPCNEDAAALAALLDVLAAEIRHLDAAVRRQVVESCRIALGETATDTARPPGRRG